MKNFLVSLPKPSNIVAREPISSIEGLRRKFFSLGKKPGHQEQPGAEATFHRCFSPTFG